MMSFFLILCNLLVNWDHGGLPACIVEIREELGFSKAEIGSLGSYVYLGFVFGSMFNGVISDKFTNKQVLLAGLVLNGLGALMYITFWDFYILSFARFMSGCG